jgi:hypothetical protein
VGDKRIEYTVVVTTGTDGRPRTDLNAELAGQAANGYRVVAATAQHIIMERKSKEKKKEKETDKHNRETDQENTEREE